MNVIDIIKWAKAIKNESREKRLDYDPKRLPKIDAYIDMIIARGEYISSSTIKMQKYTEEMQEALEKLSSYGLKTPIDQPKVKVSENPLLP